MQHSLILEIFNGEIISYNISKSPNMEQVYDMLDKAFERFDRIALHSIQARDGSNGTSDTANDLKKMV